MSVQTQQREKELPGALGEPARAAWGARHLRQTPRRAAFQFTGRREGPAAAPTPSHVMGSGWEQMDMSGPHCLWKQDNGPRNQAAVGSSWVLQWPCIQLHGCCDQRLGLAGR